ncbi:hypothetical protein CBR_g61466 [Chara braunii]|uniref:CCHC-type domain-containing protein n=1 Tax=Chara braunii TaxID=69332 RepID=A0A388K8N4_CHABU|nr:hypothetical protein CBR_g61466 [Chara braunii]|eukprot:GBG66422.1 hypothetical protein CBR_g61466 [Chara braunii]
MSGFVPACYACGMTGHIRRECPNRAHGGEGNNYSGAVANVQPAQPVLALPAPVGTRGQVQPMQYQAPRSNNYYPRMGERVEKIETIVGRLDSLDRQQQEKEEQVNKKREEEESKVTREKERKELEEAIGAQMEARFKNMYEVYFGKKEEEGEIERLKRTRGTCCQQRYTEIAEATIGVNDQVVRLRHEMNEFRREAELGRSGLEKRLELLALENEQLRQRTEKANQEMLIWKGEALQPGNKRGQVALQGITTTEGNQGRTRARIVQEHLGGTSSIRELEDLRAKYQATLDKVDILKKMKVDALAEAIKQKERAERLASASKVAGTPVSNLRVRLEQAAEKQNEQGAKKSKCKATPGRVLNNEKEINDRHQFIKEQRKESGKKNKAQLMDICEKMGLTYKKIEVTVDEVVERRVNDAFGSFYSARRYVTREKPDQEEVEEEGTSEDVAEVHEVRSDC